ncbi:AP2 domain transcription factor AP2VIIa-2 [Toxoplasma gondii MAS]|uniref:AP2 domain transcription factor AP2VIIa-2 n=1 Tax=Toxoplasma gondii MAS TaxID=943118 RepID=A0A086PLY9_TOXGO|nr:AP2 domain transcription factor AP2VIIa-2 [Toxoplasma gondii MAS]
MIVDAMEMCEREDEGFCHETGEPVQSVRRPDDSNGPRAASDLVAEEWLKSSSSHGFFLGYNSVETSTASCTGTEQGISLEYEAPRSPARPPRLRRYMDADDERGISGERILDDGNAPCQDRYGLAEVPRTSRENASLQEHLDIPGRNSSGQLKAVARSHFFRACGEAAKSALPEAALHLLTGDSSLLQDGCGQDAVDSHREVAETNLEEIHLWPQQTGNHGSRFTSEGPESIETAFRKTESDFHLSRNGDGVDSTGSTRSEDSGCESPLSPSLTSSAALMAPPQHGCTSLRSSSGRGKERIGLDAGSRGKMSETDSTRSANGKQRTCGQPSNSVQADSGPVLSRRRRQEGNGRGSSSVDTSSADYYAMHKILPKVTGVRFQAQRNRFVAEWYDRGRTRMAYFPVKLYGFEQARNLAIRCREEVLQLKLAKRNNRGDDSSNAMSPRSDENGSARLRTLEVGTLARKRRRLDSSISSASTRSWRHTVGPVTSPPFQSPILSDVPSSPVAAVNSGSVKETHYASDVSIVQSLRSIDSDPLKHESTASPRQSINPFKKHCLPMLLKQQQERMTLEKAHDGGRAASVVAVEAILRELLKRVVVDAVVDEHHEMCNTYPDGSSLGFEGQKRATSPVGFRSPLSSSEITKLLNPAPHDRQSRENDTEVFLSLLQEAVVSTESSSEGESLPTWSDAKQAHILNCSGLGRSTSATCVYGQRTGYAQREPVSAFGEHSGNSSREDLRRCTRTSGGPLKNVDWCVEPSSFNKGVAEVHELGESRSHQSGNFFRIARTAFSTTVCGNGMPDGEGHLTDDLPASEPSASRGPTVDVCRSPDSEAAHEEKLSLLKAAVGLINDMVDGCKCGTRGCNKEHQTHVTSTRFQQGIGASGDAWRPIEEAQTSDKQHLLNAIRVAIAARQHPGWWPM